MFSGLSLDIKPVSRSFYSFFTTFKIYFSLNSVVFELPDTDLLYIPSVFKFFSVAFPELSSIPYFNSNFYVVSSVD